MKNRLAFSLVEAMIILLLISVAVMVLIPLISQRTNQPRWVPLKDDNGDVEAISYGDTNFQRVGVGINPYTLEAFGAASAPAAGSAPAALHAEGARLATNSFAFFNTGRMFNSGILMGANTNDDRTAFLGNVDAAYAPIAFPNTSIVIGINAANADGAVPINSTIIKSKEVATAELANQFLIGVRDNDTTDDIAAADILWRNSDNRFILRSFGRGNNFSSDPVINLIELTDTTTTIKHVAPADPNKSYVDAPDLISIVDDEYGGTITLKHTVEFVKAADRTSPVSINLDYGAAIPLKNDGLNCRCKEYTCLKEESTGGGFEYKWGSAITNRYSNLSWEEVEEGKKTGGIYASDENEVPTPDDPCTAGTAKRKFCTCDCYDDTTPTLCKCIKAISGPFVKEKGGPKTYCEDTYGVSPNFWRTSTTSDKRLKNIHKKYEKGFAELSKIDTYLFSFKNDIKNRLYAGVIAQKLIGVFDEALKKDDKGFYSYDKSSLLYAMVNSVKEFYHKQLDFAKKQMKLNKKADKLIRMYE